MDEAALVRFFAKVEKTETCWLWKGGKFSNGYGKFYFKGRDWPAHRLIYAHYFGEPEKDEDVCHAPTPICHTRCCVNPEHLRVDTRKGNCSDKYIDGTHQYGVMNIQCKLTEAQVLQIRASDESQVKLAKKYGVCQQAISRIILRKTWKHLTE